MTLARPIVVWRGGDDPSEVPGDVRERLGPELSARLREGFLAVPPHPASATALRAALARGEVEPEHLPVRIAEYIRARGLYSSA